MVLPVRIELTTSALPRMRSTTELRQHFPAFRAEARLWSDVRVLVKAGLAQDRGGMTEKDDRAERLAAQLRENLKKRKARARGIAADAPVSADDASSQAPR